MIKNKRFFLFILFFSLFSALVISAQETPAQETAENEQTAETETEETDTGSKFSPEQKRIEMEIKISSLEEIAALCRTLGLSESGTREEMVYRLREYYGLSETPEPPEDQKVIIVDSAQTSEYFKIETTDEEYARLKGDVKLTMKDGSNIHSISAQEIIFNRTRNIMTARGKVEYIKTTDSDGTIETFRGENITVNIDDWSCTFLDGSSERRMTGEEDAYKFSGTVLSRTGDDATVLSRATITNANTEEPYWSISASRIWLLPGADFALFNAWLKVGEIPMLYIPVLFYPVDEMIIHPVIGFRSREGAFVQTTTYILGRPKPDENSQNSITKILGGSTDMEVERQGVFLKSTGKKYVSVTEPSLRLLVDHYINMGTYAGLDFMLPKLGILSNPIDLSLGLGYTRTITSAGNYSPYQTNGYDGSFDWNHTNFFSQNIPFRYKMNFESGLSFAYGSVSWKFPYYSDPFVHRDFTEFRTESMDWFKLMEEGLESQSSTSSWGAPQWIINSSFSPNVSFLNPAVSRISISNLSTTLTFIGIDDNRRSDDDPAVHIINPESPVKKFFAPNSYTIFNITASISGNPLSLGGTGKSSSVQTTEEIKDPLEGIGTPISPWENENERNRKKDSDEILVVPPLSQQFTLPGKGNLIYNIDYSITPASSAELQFMSQPVNWPSAEDVNWNDIQSILTTVSGNSKINFNVNHSSGLFTNMLSFDSSGTWKDYYFLNEEAPPYLNSEGKTDQEKVDKDRQTQYSHTKYLTLYTYDGTVRPLLNDPVFGQSNLRYGFTGTMVTSKKYDEKESPDGPELTPVWGKWVKEDLSKEIYGLRSHSFSTNLSANVFNNMQNIRLSYDLPPLDARIGTDASFNAWISTTTVSFSIRQVPDDNIDGILVYPQTGKRKYAGEWIFDPINISETLKLPANNSFNMNMIIKPEENNDITNLTSSLSLFDSSFRTTFSARKTKKSEFNKEEGKWEDYGDDVLQPEQLSFIYNKNFTEKYFVSNLLSYSLNLNTSLNYMLIKHTDSNFNFTLGNTFKINKIMDLTLSATASNNVIFRYFKGVSSMDNLTFMYPDGPQNNVLTDLIDSFNFFDEAKRKRTGFKMKTFNIDVTHYLGDWEAQLKVAMYPYENKSGTIPKYEVTTDITFLVQWKPIAEIKTNATYEGQLDKWSLE